MLRQIKGVLGRARLLAQFAGLFAFIAGGYLFPRATRFVASMVLRKASTRKDDDASTPISRPVGQAESTHHGVPGAAGGARCGAGADAAVEAIDNDRESGPQTAFQRSRAADGEGRRSSASLNAMAAAACIVGGSVCSATLAASADGERYMSVEYSDSLLGTQAMFAVRVCSGNEAASRVHDASLSARGPVDEAWQPGDVSSPPGALPWIHETKSDIPAEILVRVFDADGREISRHEGPRDVCGYARIAAAFVVDANAATDRGTR